MKAASDGWEKLHPWTLWLPVLVSLPQIAGITVLMAVPLGIQNAVMIGLWFMLLPSVIYHVLRFFTFRFRIADSQIQVEEGILWRQERKIPFSRVQDVKIQQGLVHQLVGLAKVEITTAGSEEREVKLEVIDKKVADRLKEAVTSQRADRLKEPKSDEKATLVRLSVPQLLLGGVTSRMAATFGALIGVIIYFKVALAVGSVMSAVETKALEPFEKWSDSWVPLKGTILEPVFEFFWQDTLWKSVLLILLGFAYSLAVYLARYGRYQLAEDGDVLTKSHGIMRFRSSSLARGRVQGLKVEEGLLRRWFGLCDVWVDSGGDRTKVDDQKKREPFVPVMRADQAFSLVAAVLPDLRDPQPILRRVSPKAVLRGSKKLWMVILLVMLGNIGPLGWFTLLFLPAFPLAYLLSLKSYRNRGYWLDDRYLVSRKGWFNRQTLYLPRHVVQNVSLTQSPFDRRLGLATVVVDTAGQTNTGGGTSIANLPLDEARRVQLALTR